MHVNVITACSFGSTVPALGGERIGQRQFASEEVAGEWQRRARTVLDRIGQEHDEQPCAATPFCDQRSVSRTSTASSLPWFSSVMAKVSWSPASVFSHASSKPEGGVAGPDTGLVELTMSLRIVSCGARVVAGSDRSR